MKKKTKHGSKSTGIDRISELPDEIIHCILRCLKSSRKAALTSTLSRRWLRAWRSYPILKFDYQDRKKVSNPKNNCKKPALECFQEFAKAAIERFNRDERLLIESLEVSLPRGDKAAYSPLANQLLDLASSRKSEEISITGKWSNFSNLRLTFHKSSNSNLKILRLGAIQFADNQHGNDLPLSLPSLLILDLNDVQYTDYRLLANLIASSPVLETLKLKFLPQLSKLQLCDLTNLKTLVIDDCNCLQEIEISAAKLETLSIKDPTTFTRIAIIAPRLAVLDLTSPRSRIDDFGPVISKFKHLKSLNLDVSQSYVKKLKLSNPNLEEFTLFPPRGLEEIELDAGSELSKFFLKYQAAPGTLNICEITSAAIAATNDCKAEFPLHHNVCDTQAWFVGLKSFITKFTQFNTIMIRCYAKEVTFNEKKADHSVHPRAIENLIISSVPSMDPRALLDNLFWTCRPRFFTIVDSFSKLKRKTNVDSKGRQHEQMTMAFLNLTSSVYRLPSTKISGQGSCEHRSWLHQLYKVKKTTQGLEVTGGPSRMCFELSWRC